MLISPMRGLMAVFEKVAEQVEKEMYDEEGVKQELTEIYHQLESGALSEEEFGRREGALVLRLEEIEERKNRRGRRGAR